MSPTPGLVNTVLRSPTLRANVCRYAALEGIRLDPDHLDGTPMLDYWLVLRQRAVKYLNATELLPWLALNCTAELVALPDESVIRRVEEEIPADAERYVFLGGIQVSELHEPAYVFVYTGLFKAAPRSSRTAAEHYQYVAVDRWGWATLSSGIYSAVFNPRAMWALYGRRRKGV